jgi:hypothetical protein
MEEAYLVTVNVVLSSLILSTLMIEAIHCSKNVGSYKSNMAPHPIRLQKTVFVSQKATFFIVTAIKTSNFT